MSAKGYFYQITWGVTAPRDEEFTPNKNEYGNAVSFNVKIGNNWLYEKDGVARAGLIQLENGESDRDVYLTYSPNDYSEACIIFGASPKDLNGEEVKEICADFVVSTLGEIEWKDSGRKGSEGTVKVSDLGRKQI